MDIIKRELDKRRDEIIKSLLQTHQLSKFRTSALQQVMGSVLVEFNTIVGQIESIRLEPLRRKLRSEYNMLCRGAEGRRLQSTRSEYVAANLPKLIETEIIKILCFDKRAETDRKRSKTNTFR